MVGSSLQNASEFEGLKVLIVEDETIVSFLLEDMLSGLGCSAVWHASGVNQAFGILRNNRPDAAVLDVNLSGEMVFPVAERLELLHIPFVFASGYGENQIIQRWAPRPVVQKPFSAHSLADALNSALEQG